MTEHRPSSEQTDWQLNQEHRDGARQDWSVITYHPYGTLPNSSEPQSPAHDMSAPLHATTARPPRGPEIGAKTETSPLDDLRQQLELPYQAKTEVCAAIEARAEELISLYPGNPLLQSHIRKAADASTWLVAGETGTPLPSALIAFRDEKACSPKIVLDPAVGNSLAAAFDSAVELALPAHTALGNWTEVEASPLVEDLVRKAAMAGPGFRLLSSFREATTAASERPLTAHEKAVHQAALAGHAINRFGMSPTRPDLNERLIPGMSDERAMEIQDGNLSRAMAARNSYQIGNLKLDDETKIDNIPSAAKSPLERAREHFKDVLISAYNSNRPEGQRIPNNTKIQIVYGDLVVMTPHNAWTLESSLKQYAAILHGNESSDPTAVMFVNTVRDLFTDVVDDQTFDQPLNDDVELIADGLVRARLSTTPSSFNDAALTAWLKQSYIAQENILDEEPSTVSFTLYDFETDQPRPTALIDVERFTAETNIARGRVAADNRTASQRKMITLVGEVPSKGQSPGTKPVADPDLRIILETNNKGTLPHIFGYRLAYIDRTDPQAHAFEFVREDHDPSIPCPAPVSLENIDRMVDYAEINGYRLLAANLQSRRPATVSDLMDTLRDSGTYYIPPAGSNTYTTTTGDGRIAGQCVSFASIASTMLGEVGLPHRQVDGLAIQPAGGEISALGHRQILTVYNGKHYILDATPAGAPDLRTAETIRRQAGPSVAKRLVTRLLGNGANSRPSPKPAALQKPINQLPSSEPPAPTAEQIAAGRIDQSFASLAGSRPVFRKQLVALLGLDPSYHDPDKLDRYMADRHKRDGDPYARVFQHTIMAGPIADDLGIYGQYSDEWIDHERASLAKTQEYIANLVDNPEASRVITGVVLEKNKAAVLQQTLAKLVKNYTTIVTNRAAISAANPTTPLPVQTPLR